MNQFLNERRREYRGEPLDESTLAASPFVQFERWYKQAQETEPFEATVVTLATANAHGQPSARTVLLKAFDAQGFVFYTNFDSRKAHELSQNPHAALVFFWSTLDRQVSIEGSVGRVSEAESDAYFATRPRGSQIGAWASPQSRVVSRAELEARFAAAEQRFAGAPIPRPTNWGGFRLQPARLVFWQGRENRMHDRLAYVRVTDGDAAWHIERLAP